MSSHIPLEIEAHGYYLVKRGTWTHLFETWGQM